VSRREGETEEEEMREFVVTKDGQTARKAFFGSMRTRRARMRARRKSE
jgi:hypothetical protein